MYKRKGKCANYMMQGLSENKAKEYNLGRKI